MCAKKKRTVPFEIAPAKKETANDVIVSMKQHRSDSDKTRNEHKSLYKQAYTRNVNSLKEVDKKLTDFQDYLSRVPAAFKTGINFAAHADQVEANNKKVMEEGLDIRCIHRKRLSLLLC